MINGSYTYIQNHEIIEEQHGRQLKVTFRSSTWGDFKQSKCGEVDYPCSCDSHTQHVEGTPGWIETIQWLFLDGDARRCTVHWWVYELCAPQNQFPVIATVMK